MIAPALLIGILTSCGGGASAPVSITLWEGVDPTNDRLDRHLNDYMAAHPGVKIEPTRFNGEDLRVRFENSARAGAGPDLIYAPSEVAGSFSILKIILPIDQWVPADTLARFHPGAFDTLAGHIWSLPDRIGDHLVLAFNRDLVPDPPRDLDELIAMARERTVDADGDGRPDRYGLVLDTSDPVRLIPFLTGFGGWVLDSRGQPTLSSPAMVDALTLMRDLAAGNRGLPPDSDSSIPDALFREAKAAFIITTTRALRSCVGAGLNIGVAPIPRFNRTGAMPASLVTSRGYSINANIKAEKMAAVLDLLAYLTSAAITADYVDLLILPSRREILESPRVVDDPLLSALKAAYDLGRRMPVVPEMQMILDAMRSAQHDVRNGSLKPDAAATKMQQDALARIASTRN